MNELSESSKKWIAQIVSGKSTMSQRKVSKVIKYDGSLDAIITEAKSKNVHLLQLTDDQGNLLIAGSLDAFKVLC